LSEPAGHRFSRRRLLLLGGGAVTASLAVGYGRFAVGSVFEDHLANVLGISTAAATELAATAREELGTAVYDATAAAFVAATTFPGERILPRAAREEAIETLVFAAIRNSADNLVAIGLRPTLGGACDGLLPV
jgi:hypothetical protein